MKVLYEDNHLICVEKPVNMPVQADVSGDMDLLTSIKQFIKKRDHKPGNVFLALVHRLDRPVGGAMVFAKTSKAASRLGKELQQRRIQRTYMAVVHGKTKNSQQALTHYLYKDRKHNQSRVVDPDHPKSKKAVLNYRRLAHQSAYSLIQVGLVTGRSHQIRVQMASIGHPLYGDQKYGAKVNQVGQQIALWASHLKFKHPTQDCLIQVESLPPNQAPWNLFPEKKDFEGKLDDKLAIYEG